MKSCPDCGGNDVHHLTEYTSSALGTIFEPFLFFMMRVVPERFVEKMSLFLIRILCFLRFGYLSEESTSDDTGRTRVLWEEANRRGIKLQEFHLFGIGRESLISEWKGEVRSFDALPRPPDFAAYQSLWMNDKAKLKKRLQKEDVRVASGGKVWSLSAALNLFNSLSKPVIVKPHRGSRSRHSTTHIETQEQLMSAFKKAKKLSPFVIIEEELSGFVFRGTLVNMKLEGVIRREPAYVEGDGLHNIRELVLGANTNPLRTLSESSIFHPIMITEVAETELKYQNMNWASIPINGQIVLLSTKTSRSAGGGITDVTDKMHPDNIELLQKVSEIIGDPIVGVDFIMKDVALSWKEQPRCGIIESNGAPFIDLHNFPLVGKPRSIAPAIWNLVYPSSKPDCN